MFQPLALAVCVLALAFAFLAGWMAWQDVMFTDLCIAAVAALFAVYFSPRR